MQDAVLCFEGVDFPEFVDRGSPQGGGIFVTYIKKQNFIYSSVRAIVPTVLLGGGELPASPPGSAHGF